MKTYPLVCSFFLLAGCAQSVGPRDAQVTLDVQTTADTPDAGPRTCGSWEVGPRVAIQDTSTAWRVRDAITVDGGVWTLLQKRTDVGVAQPWRLLQLRADGGVSQSFDLRVTMPTTDETIGSLAFNRTLNRGAVVVGNLIFPLDATGRPSTTSTPLADAPNTFPLTAHRDLDVTTDGFTLLAEQVRATWGVSLLQLTPALQPVGAPDQQVNEFNVPFNRSILRNHEYVLTLRSQLDAGVNPFQLQIERRSAQGDILTPRLVILSNTGPMGEPVTVQTANGLITFVRASIGNRAQGIAAIPLNLDLSINGSMHAIGDQQGIVRPDISATVYGRWALVSAVLSGEIDAPVVFVTDANGVQARDAISIPFAGGSGVLATRIAATSEGALVVYSQDAPGAFAVPIRCIP